MIRIPLIIPWPLHSPCQAYDGHTLTVVSHNNVDLLLFRERNRSFILFGKLRQVFWIHRQTDCVKTENRIRRTAHIAGTSYSTEQMSINSQFIFLHLNINLPPNYAIIWRLTLTVWTIRGYVKWDVRSINMDTLRETWTACIWTR